MRVEGADGVHHGDTEGTEQKLNIESKDRKGLRVVWVEG